MARVACRKKRETQRQRCPADTWDTQARLGTEHVQKALLLRVVFGFWRCRGVNGAPAREFLPELVQVVFATQLCHQQETRETKCPRATGFKQRLREYQCVPNNVPERTFSMLMMKSVAAVRGSTSASMLSRRDRTYSSGSVVHISWS
jgi:hypothetical protein